MWASSRSSSSRIRIAAVRIRPQGMGVRDESRRVRTPRSTGGDAPPCVDGGALGSSVGTGDLDRAGRDRRGGWISEVARVARGRLTLADNDSVGLVADLEYGVGGPAVRVRYRAAEDRDVPAHRAARRVAGERQALPVVPRECAADDVPLDHDVEGKGRRLGVAGQVLVVLRA